MTGASKCKNHREDIKQFYTNYRDEMCRFSFEMNCRQDIKSFYSGYRDDIRAKRAESKHKLRAYAHRMQYESVLSFVEYGMKVLDAGCGDGVLAEMMIRKGALVTGSDISAPNIEACKKTLRTGTFIVADSESLPFPDNSFDLVVSSHVLEHLPDFDKGLHEILRVAKRRVVVAIPTIINPCSWVQVGGGQFFLKGPRSFLALPWGFLKMLGAFVAGLDGVNENYTGHKNIPHVFRFPGIMRRKANGGKFKVLWHEASSICLPYFEFFLPLIKNLDNYRSAKIIRNFGYGTTYVIEKI